MIFIIEFYRLHSDSALTSYIFSQGGGGRGGGGLGEGVCVRVCRGAGVGWCCDTHFHFVLDDRLGLRYNINFLEDGKPARFRSFD